MRTLLPILLICVVALAVAALAQEKPPTTPAVASQDNPFSAWNKRTYGSVKKILVAYAKKNARGELQLQADGRGSQLRPNHWTHRRVTVLLLHHRTRREKSRAGNRGDQNLKGRSDRRAQRRLRLLRQGLRRHDRCDRSSDRELMGTDTPKLSVLFANLQHTAGHRGNLVTYLRIKNIVPPTSDPEFMQELMKN